MRSRNGSSRQQTRSIDRVEVGGDLETSEEEEPIRLNKQLRGGRAEVALGERQGSRGGAAAAIGGAEGPPPLGARREREAAGTESKRRRLGERGAGVP